MLAAFPLFARVDAGTGPVPGRTPRRTANGVGERDGCGVGVDRGHADEIRLDPGIGQVRGVLRDPLGLATKAAAEGAAPAPDLEVLFSRRIPDAGARWS